MAAAASTIGFFFAGATASARLRRELEPWAGVMAVAAATSTTALGSLRSLLAATFVLRVGFLARLSLVRMAVSEDVNSVCGAGGIISVGASGGTSSAAASTAG